MKKTELKIHIVVQSDVFMMFNIFVQLLFFYLIKKTFPSLKLEKIEVKNIFSNEQNPKGACGNL